MVASLDIRPGMSGRLDWRRGKGSIFGRSRELFLPDRSIMSTASILSDARSDYTCIGKLSPFLGGASARKAKRAATPAEGVGRSVQWPGVAGLEIPRLKRSG